MRRGRLAAFLSILLIPPVLLAPAGLLAAGSSPRGGCGGWGVESPYDRHYDPDRMVELEGTVGAVGPLVPRPGMAPGECFELRVDGESFPVHLGPRYFVEARDFRLQTDDSIRLRASKVRFDEGLVLMATRITRGEDVLELRDADGYPLWVPRESSP